MEHVEIHQDGFFYHQWSIDSKKYERCLIEPSRIFHYLREPCKIVPDLTLKSLFETVEKYPLLMGFLKEYSWCDAIGEFHREVCKPNPARQDLEFLSIHWESVDYSNKSKQEYAAVTGIDKDGKEWCVSYSPMTNISDLPVKINLYSEIFGCDKPFSLLEALDAIYWDISFAGNPEQKVGFTEYLKELTKDSASLVMKPEDRDSIERQI